MPEPMPNYKEMYLELFRTMTRVIKALQLAQNDTEEMFANSIDDAEEYEETV